MKCKYCSRLADGRCVCLGTYLCRKHIGDHMLTQELNHRIEKFDISIPIEKKTELSKSIMTRIKTLKISKSEILRKTQRLIIEVEEYNKKIFTEIELTLTKYKTLLCHQKFCSSQISEIDAIINGSLSIKQIILELSDSSKKNYLNGVFIKENRPLEIETVSKMSLFSNTTSKLSATSSKFSQRNVSLELETSRRSLPIEKSYTWPNGDHYEGFWLDNKPHGQGKLKYISGDYYEGLWENNSRCGQGKMRYGNGDYYEG